MYQAPGICDLPDLRSYPSNRKRRKKFRGLLSVGGTTPETNEIVTNICSCHNFFPLSSVQILFIPACCLLCVL